MNKGPSFHYRLDCLECMTMLQEIAASGSFPGYMAAASAIIHDYHSRTDDERLVAYWRAKYPDPTPVPPKPFEEVLRPGMVTAFDPEIDMTFDCPRNGCDGRLRFSGDRLVCDKCGHVRGFGRKNGGSNGKHE